MGAVLFIIHGENMSAQPADAFTTLEWSSGAEFDIWRAAHLLVERHGHEEAQDTAAFLANARRNKGDHPGERVWLRVMMAVRELRRSSRSIFEYLN
jgi:hypothetical protein